MALYVGEASNYQEIMKHKSFFVYFIIVTATFSVQKLSASTPADLDYGVMIDDADTTHVASTNLLHYYLALILFAFLLVSLFFVFMRRRKTFP